MGHLRVDLVVHEEKPFHNSHLNNHKTNVNNSEIKAVPVPIHGDHVCKRVSKMIQIAREIIFHI